MKSILTTVAVLVFVNLGFTQPLTSVQQALNQGIEYFYNAEFEQAISQLEYVKHSRTAKKEELFQANVYIAFSLIRQNKEPDKVLEYLKAAIQASPESDLDEDRIPPDLYQAFSAVRDYTLAQLMVKVNPPESSVILIDPEYGFKTSPTDPARFNKLLPNEYQLVVTKKGYQEERFTIELKAGEKDTIAVELQPKPSILKNVKKYWPWGGGVAIVTTLLIYGLSGGDDAQTDGRELPLPPSRP